MVLGQIVRERRQRLGLSQEDVASRAGVNVKTISNIEAGRTVPRPATRRLLAGALRLEGTDRAEFLGAASGLTSATAVESGRAPAVPAQVPADVPAFTARGDELAQLDILLAEGPPAATISAVSGTAGVGKTALVVHWAHRAAAWFPDGQLYVNLHGFDGGGQAVSSAQAIRNFLGALGVPPRRMPAGLDAQVALYRSLIAGRRVLVVLDNSRDAEQVRPLLPGTHTARTLVTSRSQLTSLVAIEGAAPVMLRPMAAGEARALLEGRLGPERLSAEPDAADSIIAACAGLPLALAIAAARVRQNGFPLAALAAGFKKPGRRLDILDAGDAASQITAAFSWSYTALTARPARLFRLLGLTSGLDISTAAAASLAGEPPAEVDRHLTTLTHASLLTEHASGRYSIHDLLRAYAAQLARTTDPDADRTVALMRLLDHYTRAVYAADRLLHPARDPIEVPLRAAAPGVVDERFTDERQAMAWLGAECHVLLAALRRALDTDFAVHAWQLAWGMDTFLLRQGYRHDCAAVWRVGLEAARRLGDMSAQAYALRRLRHIDSELGRYERAERRLQDALTVYT